MSYFALWTSWSSLSVPFSRFSTSQRENDSALLTAYANANKPGPASTGKSIWTVLMSIFLKLGDYIYYMNI